MKKIGMILLALIMLAGCGSKDDVDTTELLNKALNSTKVSETNAFDVMMKIESTEGANKVAMDMDGKIRQVGKFDVNTLKAKDYSGLEVELVGALDMAELGTKMEMSLYMQDGIFYINALGQKMKMDIRDMSQDLDAALEDVGESELTSQEGDFKFKTSDLKDVKITKENGYYRYLMTVADLKKQGSKDFLQGNESIAMIEKGNIYMDINDDASIRGFGMDFVMDDNGMKMNFEFTLISMDLKDAKEIVFPKFEGYQDLNSLSL